MADTRCQARVGRGRADRGRREGRQRLPPRPHPAFHGDTEGALFVPFFEAQKTGEGQPDAPPEREGPIYKGSPGPCPRRRADYRPLFPSHMRSPRIPCGTLYHFRLPSSINSLEVARTKTADLRTAQTGIFFVPRSPRTPDLAVAVAAFPYIRRLPVAPRAYWSACISAFAHSTLIGEVFVVVVVSSGLDGGRRPRPHRILPA